MLSQPGQLAAAELAIYLLLIIPCAHALYTHGKHGLVGWFFIVAFCSLRIIGSALQINNEKKNATSEATQIISGVGLSPLILGVLGVLAEANHYLQEYRSWLLRWPAEAALHLIVGAGLALVVVGIKDGKALAKVGYVLFVAVWVALLVLTVLAWRSQARGVDSFHDHSFLSPSLLLFLSLVLGFSILSSPNSTKGSMHTRVLLYIE